MAAKKSAESSEASDSGRVTEGRGGLYSEVATNAGPDALSGTVSDQDPQDPDNPAIDKF